MRKITALLLMVLLGTAVYGSGRSQGSGSGKPVFTLCISHMTNAFTTTVANSMGAAAKAAGAELIINEGGNDISRQISQIESAVNQKVNAIIIEPVSVNGVIPAVEAARKAGIPVVIFNQKISDPSRPPPS
jgi:ribose transport system substrate-binding protein/inositol transport system substrate-binding protein